MLTTHGKKRRAHPSIPIRGEGIVVIHATDLDEGVEGILESSLSELFDSGDQRLEAVVSLVRTLTTNTALASSRRLRFFLRHVLYLLEAGDELYSDCALHHDRASQLMVIRRVALERGEEIIRTTLKIAMPRLNASARARGADVLTEYSAANVDMVVYRGAVNIGQIVGAPARIASMQAEEIGAFYAVRRSVQASAKSTSGERASSQSVRRALAEKNKAEIRAACARAFEVAATDDAEIQRGRALHGISRQSHPYIGPTLHVLPRQITTPEGVSVLQSLTADVPEIAGAGFDAILLGVVDPQSTEIFFSEQDDGTICPYINNHGYWSSGRSGIDPVLGSERHYVDLVEEASRCGLRLIQDSVFATLGYPPQIPRLASPGFEGTPSTLFLGDEDAPIFESGIFLTDLESCEVIPDSHSPYLKDYVDNVARMHLGEYYQLPRPNIFCSKVLNRVLRRVCWQLRTAPLDAFRVDMAKHIGVDPLRRVVAALRRGVAARGGTDLAVVMEYWSADYRDLRFALATTEPDVSGLYLYDFPLASALRKIFMERANWVEVLSEIVAQRDIWSVSALCLIPVFIDHDAFFRPIYNGTVVTKDLVVAGLALAVAMSANGPSVFSAYDDRYAAPAELGQYHEHSEQLARRPVGSPLPHDPDGPGVILKGLLHAVKQHRILSDWGGTELLISGDKDRVSVVRSLGSGVCTRRAVFCLSRQGDASAMADQCELIFASGAGPSVALYVEA